MTTESDNPKKPLGLSKQVDLKKLSESSQVRQSFSHGRSKAVTVEVKKKRGASAPAPAHTAASLPQAAAAHNLAAPAVVRTPATTDYPTPPHDDAHPASLDTITKPAQLTDSEWEKRLRAVQIAKKAEETDDADETIRRQRDAILRQHSQAAIEESAQDSLHEMPAPVISAPRPSTTAGTAARSPRDRDDDDGDESEAKRATLVGKRVVPGIAAVRRPDGMERRSSNKLNVTRVMTSDEDGLGTRTRSLASVRRAREKHRQKMHLSDQEAVKVIREVTIPETISVQDLANRMAVRGSDVIKSLMKMGVLATINQIIDADTAELIVGEFGHKFHRVAESDVEIGLKHEDDSADTLQSRAPVVTIMGHVDHGKTSLLDALRQTDVVSQEAGGITQHIGAYQVTMKSGKKITFIDTPGHAAFTEMRARGANVTDIVVLVVAADDGIKEQTIEAINHAKAAGVPIVVAMNKIDKPDADPNRVRMELLQHELVVESMGGEILEVEVSAKAKTNLEKLEEAILLQSEILDLKANPKRSAEGVIIEARMERGRGSVATVLVQRGTLRSGDIFVAGREWGRVRALSDDHGRKCEAAGPSTPVEVLGLNGTPMAGDDFVVVTDEAKAREVAEFRQRKQREQQISLRRVSTEQMFSDIASTADVKELAVVIKSDVQGSLEAISGSLAKLTENAESEVALRVLHAAVGGINESDIALALASRALVIGFNVRANPQAREMARREGLSIQYYSIIYDLIDDVKASLSGLLKPTLREKFIGNALIREVFNITKVGKVAGCMITEGMVKRGAKVRLLRDNVVIHEGSLKTLKRFKEEVREVREGYECGMAFENYHDIRANDVIECFEIEEIAREL